MTKNISKKILNKNLIKARSNKNDEFYTQLSDIENELKYYKPHFKNKIIYCNCDDFKKSNFVKYFLNNFNKLKLKKLIVTCYFEENRDLFNRSDLKKAIKLEYNKKKNISFLKGNGDFRSKECVELLKQSDIIVTNPPFSLFREFLTQMFRYNKKFIIIGNLNAITYKEIFPFVKDNLLWFGASIHSGDIEFEVPNGYSLNAAKFRIDKKNRKFIRVKGVRWFTNFDYAKRHKDLILYRKYSPEKYPKYNNYNAINVDKVKNIPIDYDGVMGVPITFLDRYNPEQFEIIGITDRNDFWGLKTIVYSIKQDKRYSDLNASCVVKIGDSYKVLYRRILIRRRK